MYRNYIYAAVVAVLFGSGWIVRGWYEATLEQAEDRATAVLIERFEKKQAEVAQQVEIKLTELKANERIIERYKTEIVDRPVYSNECIDDDGLLILDAIAEGRPTKFTDQMPGHINEANR